MGCNPTIKDDSYAFFEDIKNYIEKADNAQQNDMITDIDSKCKDFYTTMRSSFENEQIAISVCKEIVKLYKSLNNLNANSECSKDYKSDCGFFNYWVNFKIRKNTINESDSIKTIYNGIESQFMGVDGYDMNINFLCDINKNDLHKMNILYRLYKKYSDIDGILEKSTNETKKLLLSYSTACCTDYLEANYICNGGNDDDSNNHSQFCTQLEKFKTKYEELYSTVNGKDPEYSKNFIKLSECKNNNIMTTTLVGTTVGLVPLLVGLYKFTPLRQLINIKKGKLTQEYGSNDGEMRNIMLMDQGSEQINSQQGTYNIKYHSV